MSLSINTFKKRRVAIVASNPSVSKQTGWPIGFWWSALTHPYWEFVGRGHEVEIFSPDGGKLEGDSYSDPRDAIRYSAEDLISLGFISAADHRKLIEESRPLNDWKVENFDAVLLPGARGPCTRFTTTSGRSRRR